MVWCIRVSGNSSLLLANIARSCNIVKNRFKIEICSVIDGKTVQEGSATKAEVRRRRNLGLQSQMCLGTCTAHPVEIKMKFEIELSNTDAKKLFEHGSRPPS